jgi:transcriptional regulator with XRE-family HTH domain
MHQSLGQTLKSARTTLRLTQRQLAAQVGIKGSYIAYLESDRRRPSLALLSRLAEALGLQPRALFMLAFPEACPLLGHRQQVPRDQAWRQFITDKALLTRNNVQPGELEVLAQTNLLGRIGAPSDFLFILNSIRQAAEME